MVAGQPERLPGKRHNQSIRGGVLPALCAGLAIGIFIADVPCARAQFASVDSVRTRVRPDLDPLGIELGLLYSNLDGALDSTVGRFLSSLQLSPKTDLAVVYDDNIFKVADNEISDTIMIFQPSFSVDSDWVNHAVKLAVSAAFALHASNDDEDYEDYKVELGGRADITDRSALRPALTFQRGHEARDSPDDPGAGGAPSIFHRVDGELVWGYRSEIIVAATLLARRYDYDDNGAVNNDDRDRNEYEGKLRVGYEFQPGFVAFVEPSVNLRDYLDEVDDSGANRDSRGYSVLAGVRYDASAISFVELGLGVKQRTFEDSQFSDVTDIGAEGAFIWNATNLITAEAALRRELTETTVAGSQSIVGTTWTLDIYYDPLENLIFNSGVNVANLDFEGSNRVDNTLTFRLGARYLITPDLYAVAEYTFVNSDSTEDDEDFANNRVLLRVEVQR